MERKWWTLMAVSVATFMLLLDITVVNTALPSIAKDLHASFNDLQWVIDAYTLALAAVVLTAGSLADRLGRRAVFAAGLTIFSVASLAAGLAPDATFLNVSRAVEGIGGAAMFAVSLALVAQEFPAGRERGTAMAIYGATIGMSVAVGPLVGGAITDGLGWRWVFFVNVPVGIAALATTYMKVRESRNPNARRIDWLGLGTLSGGLFLLVLALLRGNDAGWGSAQIIAEFGAAAALLAAFIGVERSVPEPMLPLGLFRRRAFTGVQLAAVGVSASLFALFLYLTLYLQDYLHNSPLQAGVRYLPITLGAFIAAPIAGVLLRACSSPCTDGGGAGGDGYRAAADVRHRRRIQLDRPASRVHRGRLGVGLLNPVIADVALSVVPKERSGMAAGVNDTFRQVGVAVGTRGLGSGFPGPRIGQGRHGRLRGPRSPRAPAAAVDRVADGWSPRRPATQAIPHGARELAVNATHQGFLSGLNSILLIGGVVAFVGAALALWLVREHEIERDVVPDALPEAYELTPA